MLLRARFLLEEGRERDRSRGKEKVEGGTFEEKGEEAEEESQTGEGVFNRKDELFRAR